VEQPISPRTLLSVDAQVTVLVSPTVRPVFLQHVDGVEGLDVYRAHRAQIAPVITDMIMPKASGFGMGQSAGTRP
jgi:hypothetical protein